MSPTSGRTIGIGTLVKYLFGSRQAILEIAACPKALWLGLIFVLSAGLAREYDGEDLLHEPWHAIIPVAASLATSFLLYWLARLVFKSREISYRSFLGLYWLTAPLAWIYAFPVERFVSAADAVSANLWFLGIVSLWRVALMTRVVAVIFHCHWVAAFFVVMFFADTVAMVIAWLTPLPILQFMGGIRLTESEALIMSVGYTVRFYGVLLWPIFLIGLLVVQGRYSDNKEKDALAPSMPPSERHRAGASLWILAASSLVIWAPVLPATQSEQINRRHAERDLRAGKVREALQYMSQRERGDFPPHWDPPPRPGYGEQRPSLVDIQPLLSDVNMAEWVRAIYEEKLRWNLAMIRITRLNDEQLARFVAFIEAHPPELDRTYIMADDIRRELGEGRHPSDPAPPISDERRELLESLRKIIRPESPPHLQEE